MLTRAILSPCLPMALMALQALAPQPAAAGPALQACHDRLPAQADWLHREDTLRLLGQLPPSCIKLMVRECGDAANQAMLDGDQAAVCSLRYEALLRHVFRGDFQALLAWWRGTP